MGPVRNPVLQHRVLFPGSSRLGIEPKTPGWLVQDPTTRPIGDLITTIGGSGAHPLSRVAGLRMDYFTENAVTVSPLLLRARGQLGWIPNV